MPVVYECDADGCDVRAESWCATTDQGKKVLLPPPYWRLMEIIGRDVPAILCPGCADKVAEHQRAANDPAPAPARPKLGVLDGGKKED